MKGEEEPDSLAEQLGGSSLHSGQLPSAPGQISWGGGATGRDHRGSSGDGRRLRGAGRRQDLNRSCFFLRNLQSMEEESEPGPDAAARRDAGRSAKPSAAAGTARREAGGQSLALSPGEVLKRRSLDLHRRTIFQSSF